MTKGAIQQELREALARVAEETRLNSHAASMQCETVEDAYRSACVDVAKRIRAALAAAMPPQPVGLREALEKLTNALAKVSPIETNDTPDYAELTFGEHQTQAMTMQPNDWLAIEEAYLEARAALGSSPLQVDEKP